MEALATLDKIVDVNLYGAIQYVRKALDVGTKSDDSELDFLPSARKSPPSEDVIRLINLLHHIIMCDVTVGLLGDKHPKIEGKFWIAVPDHDFLQFMLEIAREVIRLAKQTAASDQTVQIAVSLQQIIALRHYVYSVKGSDKIDATKDFVYHQDVLFFFVGFRALVMYILPIQPTGMSRVAENLPKYAKDLKFNLQTVY